jgi:hypothetical protein
VLERVHRLGVNGRLVEDRNVPQVEVRGPQREGDERVGERAQPAKPSLGEQRLQQRAGEPEHDQQRGEVPDQQVLAHVGDDQLVADLGAGGDQRRDDQGEAGEEARLPQRAHRATLMPEVDGADRVRGAEEGEREHLQRREGEPRSVAEDHGRGGAHRP